MKQLVVILLGLFLVVAGRQAVAAQSYAINWFTVDGGGGTSTGAGMR